MVLERIESDSPSKPQPATPKPAEPEKKQVWEVVDKLPTQEVRQIEKEGVIINFITVAEALGEILNAGS